MDKIIRRTEYAKAYRARQKIRETAFRKKFRRRTIGDEHRQLDVARHKIVKEHKAARREDWFLGPVAPRRDAGAGAATFGTLPQQLLNVPVSLERKEWGIRAGDRVAVTDGAHRERGKIGTVREVRFKQDMVLVEGMNMCDVAVPEHLLVSDPDKTPSRAVEFPIPLSSVRLVYPFKNPETGRKQDTIIDSITTTRAPAWRAPGTPATLRYITGTDHILTWPPPSSPPSPETHPSDTPASIAHTRTFIPTLIQPPLPPSVIDELRNKYSKYRDRHEESYISYKNAKAERRDKEMEAKRVSMMSPMEEWRWRKMKEVEEGKRERREREARGEVVREEWEEGMGEGLLVGIGRVMAENKGGWMERKGMGREVLVAGEVGVGKEEARA